MKLSVILTPYVADEAVQEYLEGILCDPEVALDDESLRTTIEPFVDGNVETLMKSILQSDEIVALQAARAEAVAPGVTLSRTSRMPPSISPGSTEASESSDSSSNPAQPQKTSKQRGGRTRQGRRTVDPTTKEHDDPSSLEDDSSAWMDCQASGMKWGGRGKGGRGEYAGAVNSVKSNIHLTNVNVCLKNGMELLTGSTMDIVKGHKYALIGRNGVGKSTLLQRLAQKAIPGMPHDMRILLVRQQIEGTDQSSLQTLVQADQDRLALLQEQEEAEKRLEAEGASNEDLEQIAERLGDIAAELDAVSADTAEDRALEILRGLQFTEAMIHGPTKHLSGGWRMRLALAQALMVQSDLLLFDECTNHLDLTGLEWLIHFLNNKDCTLIVISHDRHFLDAVCTDVVVLEHQRLKYHVGNYSEYSRQQQEKAAREAQILDAAERQRSKAEAFVQKQQALASKKSADSNKQRQAKMIREKKLDRLGLYRDDGKRYKQFSLQTMSEDSIRLGQKVHIEVDEPVVKMHFPKPTWSPAISPGDAVLRLEGFRFGFDATKTLLKDTTVSVNRGSKIAIVGSNGAGKSTLMNLIAGDIDASKYNSKGVLWIHPNIRIGHVTQYAVEELESYADMTVAEYAEEKLRSGKFSAAILAKASGNVRQYLGAFGLGGRQALQKIGKLSGGERMRLCFATVLADECHLLILDESTNHVDIETLDAMSEALNEFDGSVLMVSHNQYFLSGFCNELWVLENGHLSVTHSDTQSFDDLFSEYRQSVFQSGHSLSTQRREKATMAKRATKQRAGARQNTALL